ncbi:MAG: hypothetical protein GX800_05910 [Clostridiaceae bacterium]|nr:hypothetical protein [Clostridiaceae bacterium]
MKKRMIFLIVVVLIAISTQYILATPGDENDPIITLSYIKQVLIPSITDQIEKSTAPKFEVVDVAAGKNVICEAGTEFILRKGSANIIATQKGGIANVTSGVDLQHGVPIPPNSLLIVPLSDGRGLTALDDIILMIKGKYTIQEVDM